MFDQRLLRKELKDYLLNEEIGFLDLCSMIGLNPKTLRAFMTNENAVITNKTHWKIERFVESLKE